jgi:hypothetical protein
VSGVEIERCGYAVVDKDGDEQPCDRPATGWRWYQDVGEHEDLMDAACDWHENEGGRRIHEAEAAVARVRALADEWATEGPSLVRHACGARDVHEGSTLEQCAIDIRAALTEVIR